MVPARVGGVDLSTRIAMGSPARRRPRPCGRGGFKHSLQGQDRHPDSSPPVWAGWI